MKVRILNTPGSVPVETDRFAAWLLKNFNEKTTFEQVSTSIAHTEEPLNNSRWPGYVKLQNGYTYYKQFSKGCDMLVINWHPFSGSYDDAHSTSNAWYLYGTFVLEIGCYKTDDFYRQLTHESIHGFWWKVMDLGYPRNDTMDLYDKEYEVEAPDGNRARNILALQPYVKYLFPSTLGSLQAALKSLLDLYKSKEVVPPSGIGAIKAVFGEPGIDSNIVQFQLPYPLLYEGVTQKFARAHYKAVPNFIGALSELKQLGLDIYVRNYGGIYNVRLQRTGAKVSTHAWGIAIDVEPVTYPQGSTKRLPKQVVDVFARHGFSYGGDFTNPDPMHFQLCKGY